MIHAWAITDTILQEADKWSDFYSNNLSINQDPGSKLAGVLAEIIFQRLYPDAERISNTDRQADFVLDDLRVDVKCKKRNFKPLDYYEVSVLDYQKDFDVDFYYFFSYNAKTQVLYQLGYISKEDYFKKAVFMQRGQIDTSNNYEVKEDCWNLKINQLK